MKRAFDGPLAALAAAALMIGSVAAAARAQTSDPFPAPSSSAGKVEPASDSKVETRSATREPERIVKSLEQWQKQLPHEQFMVTRMKATEAAFSGKYATGHWKGTFLCVCCGAKLFDGNHKFDSGTGWPSFDRPVNNRALETGWDYSEHEARVEVTCRRCGAHLGHVFQDGPTATGLRFCINSLALKLDSEKGAPAAAAKKKTARPQASRTTRKPQRPRPSEPPASDKSAADDQPKSQF
jgi:peptide-methionine (R)-S-oxide reductase